MAYHCHHQADSDDDDVTLMYMHVRKTDMWAVQNYENTTNADNLTTNKHEQLMQLKMKYIHSWT